MSDGFYFRKGAELDWSFPIGSGVVVEIGDLLNITGGKATRMTATSDNLTFIGAAKSAHGSTDGSGTIQVYMPLPVMVHEYPLDAATDITIGDALQWNAAQKLKKSVTDAIATAVESKLAATTIRCVFRMPAATSTQIRLGTGDAS